MNVDTNTKCSVSIYRHDYRRKYESNSEGKIK